MNIYTQEEVNEEVANEWHWIKDEKYPEDMAHQLADSALPIYYADIVRVWQELPAEYSNKYTELRTDLPDTIYELMTDDLYLYYSYMFTLAIQAKQEEESGK
jgi:hypothetical protein